MVEVASDKFICIVDESKLSKGLGRKFPLPVEITPFCHEHIRRQIELLPSIKGCRAVLRMGNVANNKNDGPNIAVTDNGNYIVDLYFDEPIESVSLALSQLTSVVGVVETGIFANMATAVIVAGNNGTVRVAGEGGEKAWW